MKGLVHQVIAFIENEQLLQPSDKVLVAVSAGVDSVVLAHILDAAGYRIGIAHANFQLREDESDLDEQLVEKYTGQLKAPFFTRKFDTLIYAREQGISTQMAARELRYQWFEELREDHGYQAVATGHHSGDLLETILLNFTRGTGIAGFHGILPRRGALVRPLLATGKQQLLEYARTHDLQWREDPSNQSDYYQRNLIRNQVVPLLKQLNPSLEQSTLNTAEIIRSVENQYHRSLDQLRARLFVQDQKHTRILKSGIKEMKPALLADLLEEYGFNLDQCRSLLQQAMEHTGKVFRSDSHILNIDRDEIIISPGSQENTEQDINPGRSEHIEGIIEQCDARVTRIGDSNWSTAVIPPQQYTVKPGKWVAAFDNDKIKFPLKVRKWKPGDRFYPLGMDHPKKLSDFLIDSKIPLNYKSGVQVLLSAGEIVWVVGYRIDDRYKITDKTKSVLEIKLA